MAWQKDFAGRFKATAPPFGTSMSPLVAGGLLIVHAGGHEGGALIAFDPATGAEKWTLEGDGPSYSSPILASFGGQQQLVIQVHRKILGVDPASGRALWSVPFVTPCDQNIVTPLRAGDLIVVSSQDTGTQGIRADPQGHRMGPGSRLAHAGRLDVHELARPRERTRRRPVPPEEGTVLRARPGDRQRSSGRASPGRAKTPPSCMAEARCSCSQGDGTLLVLPAGRQRRSPRRIAIASPRARRSRIPVPTELGILIKDEDGLSLYGASHDQPPGSVSAREQRAERRGDVAVRVARAADAESVAEIYNQGIAERSATFETDPRARRGPCDGGSKRTRSASPCSSPRRQARSWAGPPSGSYRDRRCYAGVGEFSVYIHRGARGRGVGRAAPGPAPRGGAQPRLLEAPVPDLPCRTRRASALCRSLGFREVGTYERHGRLDGRWLDVVIVERLIPENQP